MTAPHTAQLPIRMLETSAQTPELLEELIRVFLAVFPEDARYVPYIRECAECASDRSDPLKQIHQWLVAYDDEYVGIQLVNYLKQRDFGFVRYIGLLPGYRYMGIGKVIQKLTVEALIQDAAAEGRPAPLGVCGELLHPDLADSEEEHADRLRRIAIFERLGYIHLNVNYVEPVIVQGSRAASVIDPQSLKPKQMLLLFAPIKPLRVTKELTAKIVEGVLLDNYQLTIDSWYVAKALSSVYAVEENIS